MERYLGGEEIDQSRLIGDLRRRSGFVFLRIPAAAASAISESFEVATRGSSPPEHRLPECSRRRAAHRGPALACDPDGPPLAEVVKTTSDPTSAGVSLAWCFHHQARDATVHVSGHFSPSPTRPEFPGAAGK